MHSQFQVKNKNDFALKCYFTYDVQLILREQVDVNCSFKL